MKNLLKNHNMISWSYNGIILISNYVNLSEESIFLLLPMADEAQPEEKVPRKTSNEILIEGTFQPVSSTCLRVSRRFKAFVLYTHASDVGLGALLIQEQDCHFKIILYLCRTFTPAESNYSASVIECLAIVHALAILKASENVVSPAVDGDYKLLTFANVAIRP